MAEDTIIITLVEYTLVTRCRACYSVNINSPDCARNSELVQRAVACKCQGQGGAAVVLGEQLSLRRAAGATDLSRHPAQ